MGKIYGVERENYTLWKPSVNILRRIFGKMGATSKIGFFAEGLAMEAAFMLHLFGCFFAFYPLSYCFVIPYSNKFHFLSSTDQMISLTCSCGKSFTFKEKFLGQKFRCSQCGVEMIVAEQVEIVSSNVPEPDMPTEFVANPEQAAALKAPPPKPQPGSTPQTAASLTPDYAAIAAGKPKNNAPVEDEYVLISSSAPELLKEIAIRQSEDSGPPSEALSVILGRAAVAEHLMHLEDTLGVRATPVPVPMNVQNKRRKKRSPAEPDIDPTQPERPVLHHAVDNKPNQLVMILLIVIGILLFGILALLLLRRGDTGKEQTCLPSRQIEWTELLEVKNIKPE